MKKRHILVIDDDLMNSGALREHLKSQGFRVTLAENCEEGRQVLSSKSSVDLIILDQLLPDGKGTDLLQSMAKNGDLQKPPVIMSSSLIDPKNLSWETILQQLPPVSQSLIQAYMPKPYSFDNIDTVVDLVFEATAAASDPKTLLSGDYRHPSKRRRS